MRLLVLAALLAVPISAQVPPRPKLATAADTNSAAAYATYGFSVIQQDPAKAGRAFYWATRIDPGLAQGWYGLWIASLLTLPDLAFDDYLGGARSAERDSLLHRVDSLRDRADEVNPLLHHGLDELLIRRWIGSDDLNQFIFGNPAFGGWLAYSRGDFATAIDRYARAIKQDRRAPELHWARGRAFLLLGAYDSALAEMRTYRDSIRLRGEKRTLPVLATHEMADFAIGRAEELRGQLDAARQEYDTALIENLGFVPAHVALARLAIARHDTAEALKEMDQATQAPDAERCYTYGVLLWATRRAADAAVQFRQAIAADSDYAPPYLALAYLVEGSGDDSLAAVLYRRFIAGAAVTMAPQLATARQRLAALEAKEKH